MFIAFFDVSVTPIRNKLLPPFFKHSKEEIRSLGPIFRKREQAISLSLSRIFSRNESRLAAGDRTENKISSR